MKKIFLIFVVCLMAFITNTTAQQGSNMVNKNPLNLFS